MKTKALDDLRQKSMNNLKKLVDTKKQDLEKVLISMQVGKEKNLKKSKNLKREIAQVLTAIREKEILEEENSQKKA